MGDMMREVPRLSVWRRSSDGVAREVTALEWRSSGEELIHTGIPWPEDTQTGALRYRPAGLEREVIPFAEFLATHERLSERVAARARARGAAWEQLRLAKL